MLKKRVEFVSRLHKDSHLYLEVTVYNVTKRHSVKWGRDHTHNVNENYVVPRVDIVYLAVYV